MEKRMRASRLCCQARRVQMAPSSQAQPAPTGGAPTTSCPNCPATRQTRGPALPNGGLTRSLPCQALPPPPPCAPKCPPCPPCPPTLSTPLKASDYIHTTTECYPTNAQDDPCRWDNTTCYNEGNDASGNTIRQWNTRCQFASNSTGANCGAPNGPGSGSRVVAGPAVVGGGSSILGPTPASVITNSNNNNNNNNNNIINGSAADMAGGAAAATVSEAITCDLNRRATINGHGHGRGRATNDLSTCSHASCRSAVAAAAATDHRFRKCKKELLIHFPSGKCGTQFQLRRSAKLGNLITPPRPNVATATTTTTTTARPDFEPTAAAAVAAGFATRSRPTTLARRDVNSIAKDLLAESPMSTTRAPPLLTTPLTPLSPAVSASAASIRYYPQVSLIDDDMPPVSRAPQADTSIFTNRASQLRWLQNQRKLYLPATKRSIIEPQTLSSSSSSSSPPPPPPQLPTDFYKHDFDWGRIKR